VAPTSAQRVPRHGRPRRAPGIKLVRQVLVIEDGYEMLSTFSLGEKLPD
jgi:hypothetical protein